MSRALRSPRIRVSRFPLLLTGLLLCLVALHPHRPATVVAQGVFPAASWQTKTPAEVNLDATKINQFATNVGGDGVIIKDGYLVKSWGTATARADWASAGKPVLSTMLLFAVKEGKLASVDALVDPWWSNGLSSKDKPMTFRHLANNVSGYTRGEAPGAAWAYNDYAINLYAKTLDKVFNTTATNFNNVALASNRLGALQFQDGSLFSSRGGHGVYTTPRDFARIGWFWLNKGNWNGVQLLPATYFDQYMKPSVAGSLPRTTVAGTDYLGVGTYGGGSDQTAYGPGIYGFNWWFNAKVGTTQTLTWPDAPSDTFQANGHWYQEVMTIIPSLNMVVAARGNWGSFSPGSSSAGMNQNLKLLKEAVLNPTPTRTSTPITRTPTATSTPISRTPTATPTPISRTPTATPTPISRTPTTTPSNSTILLADDFNRSDSASIENGWVEVEASGALISRTANKLLFADTSDVVNRPIASHAFAPVTSGTLTWDFDFDWKRSGSEGTYSLFMQLGQGSLMSQDNQGAGVGVNLVWTALNGTHELLAVRRGGVLTGGTVVSGPNHLSVSVDVSRQVYTVRVNNLAVLTDIAFDQAVSLDTVRFFTDGLNEVNFTGRSFDNVVIKR